MSKNKGVENILTDVELTADEWKWVLKQIGRAFAGGKDKMSMADKKLFMKIQVITAEESIFEKMEKEAEDE